MSLLHASRHPLAGLGAAHLQGLHPRAAIPGGSLQITGTDLLNGGELPEAFLGDAAAPLDFARPSRLSVRVPEGAVSGDLTLRYGAASSNTLHAGIGVPLAENLHLISNPAVDADGAVYAMVSGPRGERVPVSIYRIDRDLQVRPFARDLLNVSALVAGPAGYLYASSRSEGTVYRLSSAGAVTVFAEGMGIATGLAFDREGYLYVGDRSGTIFKISPQREIFVFATLEPSVAAYHLAFRDDGVLLVTAPNTSSNQNIYAIAPSGETSVFFTGLGRPQGMALDVDGNLYVAASHQGRRGLHRIDHERRTELIVSGNDLVGLCFLDDGCAALATANTLYHVDLGIHGRPLV